MMIPKFVDNYKYVSRRCSLHEAPYGDILSSESGWTEKEDTLPSKVRCKGFRGVLKILGILVYVTEEGTGSQTITELLPRGKLLSSEAENESYSLLKNIKPSVFKISSTFFKKS